MSTHLASPGRIALPAVPALGMVITPFLPFASTPTLWLGVPAPVLWFAAMILATVVALRLVERSYLRSGGAEQDRAELDRAELERTEAGLSASPSPEVGH